jgi:hypothetical protein
LILCEQVLGWRLGALRRVRERGFREAERGDETAASEKKMPA